MKLYIKVGKLMNRSLILKLLEAVPPQDLERLKSICVRTVPTKYIKKKIRNWAWGLCGVVRARSGHHTSPRRNRIKSMRAQPQIYQIFSLH